MKLDQNMIVSEAGNKFIKLIMNKEITDIYKNKIKPGYFHLITEELKNQLVDVVEGSMTDSVRENYIVGEYCHISLRGDLVSNEKLMSLRWDDKSMDMFECYAEKEFPEIIKDNYECHIVKDSYLWKYDIVDFVIYSALEFLNRNAKTV
jgi:hypothetical protein